MKPLVKRQMRIAGSYGCAAVLVVAGVFLSSGFPPFGMWLAFTVAFVLLESNAVEVNDRMLQSSGLMVLLTAGALFALEEDATAMSALVTMAALGSVTVRDIRQRRWFQPLANLGQMVVAASAAGFVLDTILSDGIQLSASTLLLVAAAGAAASLVYTAIQLTMIRLAVKAVYGSRNLLPWSGTHFLFSSQVVMGMVGGLLGAALLIVQKQAVVALFMAIYVIAHLSLSSYSQLREAHQSAIRGFVKVLEARDMYTRGHTERVAYFSQLIGEQLHYTGTQLERLRWAALIHDLGKLAIPGHLLTKRGALEPEEYEEMRSAARSVEQILGEVDFLESMVSISGVHYLDLEAFDAVGWSLDASIVAAADAFDAMTSTRSYRMAMTQPQALVELRSDETGRFEADVVDALEAALERTGEVYGAAVSAPSELTEVGRA